MTEIAHHNLGETWNVVASFRVDEVLTNPGTVSATLRKPSGLLVSYPNGNPAIVPGSTGVYTILDTAVEVGVHYLEVVGTAPAAGLERFSFVVDPRWPADLLDDYALTSIEDVELMLDRVGQQGSVGYEHDDVRFVAELINVFSKLVLNYVLREFQPTTAATTATGVNTLNSATVNVGSTAGFTTTGTFELGGVAVTYTGVTSTSFTGCSAHAATTGGEAVDHLVARKFEYDGDGVLSLDPFEAREIWSVVMYSDRPDDAITLTEGYDITADGNWYAHPRELSDQSTYLALQLPRRSRPGRWCEVTVTGKWGAGVVPADVKHVVEAEVSNTYWAARIREPVGGGAENFLPQPPRQIGETGYALDPRSERILDAYANREFV